MAATSGVTSSSSADTDAEVDPTEANDESDDEINVTDGETAFEGLINVNEDEHGNQLPGGHLDGDLIIHSDGTLYMRDNITEDGISPGYLGPAKAWVNEFTIEPEGILALELLNEFPDAPYSHYPQVFADVANIEGGGIEVRVGAPTVMFHDEYEYDNVIDANVLNGTLGPITTVDEDGDDGAYALSIFLDATPLYDGEDNVDLRVNRVPFGDDRFGLTPNQQSAANAIETDYDPGLTGDYGDLMIELFELPTHDDYAEALSTLHGAQYATYLQSLGWQGNRFNGILNDMGECALMELDGMLTCRRESGGVWGTVNYGKETIDADPAQDATGLDGDRWLAAIGGDITLGEHGVHRSRWRLHQERRRDRTGGRAGSTAMAG